MTSHKPLGLTALLATVLFIPPSIVIAQEVGGVPKDVTANRINREIHVTSNARGNEFSLTLEAREFQPLSSERLKLSIDGRDVEIVTIPLGSDLTGTSEAEILTSYQRWVEARSQEAGWQFVPESNESFAFSNGKASLLWQMQRQVSDTASLEYRIIAATTNQSNVVALMGSSNTAASLAPLRTFLRTALLTLKPEKPAETLAPTPDGADLRGMLRMREALLGQQYRALLNKRLMTETDNSLAAAVPVEPEVLIPALRQELQLAGEKPDVIIVVFDGKSAHVISLNAYDPLADAFTYWDPWGKGSFLAAGSNAAGITATADPNKERFWIIKSEQLNRIIYAITLSFDDTLKLAARMPLGAFGALGDRIGDAKQADLFTWFHLEQTGEFRNVDGHQVLTFRPLNAQFRSLVSLDMTLDETGRILAADLQLRRSFINDRANAALVLDLVKSFLESATHDRDDVFHHIAAEVLQGRKQDATSQLSLTKLKMANTTLDEGPALLISLETVR